MNRLRHFCAATVLTLTFAFAVFAGDMATGVVQSPPPPTHASVIGDISCGFTAMHKTTTETSFVDPVTQFTLNIMRSVLALF
jgi:hypothetical protein